MNIDIKADMKARKIITECFKYGGELATLDFKRGGWLIRDRDEAIAYCESNGFTVTEV